MTVKVDTVEVLAHELLINKVYTLTSTGQQCCMSNIA